MALLNEIGNVTFSVGQVLAWVAIVVVFWTVASWLLTRRTKRKDW